MSILAFLAASAAIAPQVPEPPAIDVPPPVAVSDSAELPPYDSSVRSIRFTLPDDDANDLRRISDAHEAMCRSMGSVQCQVISYSPYRNDRFTTSGILTVRVPAGMSDDFANKLIAARGRTSFQKELNDSQSGSSANSISRLIVERDGAEAELEAVRKFVESADPELQRAATRHISRLESEISRYSSQLADRVESKEYETVRVSYQPEYGSRGTYSRAFRDLDEAFALFLLFSLGAIALALLGALYFGVMGFLLLKMRQWAIRWKLLRQPESRMEKTSDDSVVTSEAGSG